MQNGVRPYSGRRGHSYADWEDYYIDVIVAFEMPIKYWTRLATTYLDDDAMRTRNSNGAQKHSTVTDPLPWTKFSQTMHLFAGILPGASMNEQN